MKKWRVTAAGLCIGLAAISLYGCQNAGESATAAEETAAEAGSEEKTDGSDQESQEPMTMRVATWNVDSKAHPDIKKMSEIIKENGVEIMGFQEIDVNNTRNDYDMVQDFVNDDYPYVHFAKGRDFANGGFGVGVTSQYELKEVSSIPIESTGSKATKVLERTVFEKDGREIAFYVTHTSWENTDLRRRQFAEIIERVKMDPTEYKIMVADWNADQSLYEYTMFEDGFHIANGKDGKWLDTFNGTDDSMKVLTVDNIITTKNIRITDVGTVHSDMADHDMLWADLEFLDQAEGEPASDNRALGQEVTASSTKEGSDPYMLNDYDMDTCWTAAEGGEQSVVLELDRVYDGSQAEIYWGDGKPESCTVEVSTDGSTYREAAVTEAEDHTEAALDGEVKFIRLDVNGSQPVQIRELQVFGDFIVPESVPEENLLENGDMETEDGWEFADITVSEEDGADQPAASYEFGYGEDAHGGSRAAVITKTGKEAAGDGVIRQTISIEPNKRYQLSFWHKTDTLDSPSFTYEINQKDKDGNTISTHLAKLNDNLNMSREYREFDYNFITSPYAVSADIVLHVVAGEGSLYLDDVAVREVIPTEAVFVEADKAELEVGETGKVMAQILPGSANDLTFHWTSSDESVITVAEDGTVTAVGEGSAYARYENSGDLTAESSVLITVK